MKLICVKNEDQLNGIEPWLESNSGHRVLPLMPKAALGLLDRGLKEVRLPIDLLSREECSSIRQQAVDLSKSWYRNLRPKAEFMGIDLMDCCRIQMLGFFQDVIAAEMLVPRLLAAYEPREAVFFKRPSVASFGLAMHDGTADVFEAVLQWRFLEAGVKVTIQDQAAGLMGLWPATRFFWERTRQRGLNFYRRRRRMQQSKRNPQRLRLADLFQGKPLVVGYGDGYDLLVIWPYLKHLAREIDGFPVLLNAKPDFDSSTLRSGLRGDETLRYLFVGDIPLRSGEVPPDLGASRQALLQALKSGEGLPPMLKNPLLSFQFEFLWDALLAMSLKAARQAASFFAQCRTALYLDDYCSGPGNRAWTEAANQAGVLTATVSHGSMNLVEFFDFNARWALSWGELGRRNWAMAAPDKQDQVIISGDPSMETVRQQCAAAQSGPRQAVVLMTGGFLHQAWTDMDLPGFLNTWEQIARIARERPAMEFVVKPHPSVRDLGDWYRRFFARQGLANVRIVDRQRLEDLLPAAFFAVLVGKPGTAGIVATLANVPFVYLDTMLCREVPGYQIWCEVNGVSVIKDFDNLGRLIDRMFTSREDREALEEQNSQFSQLYLTRFEPERVCRELGLQKAAR